MAKREIDAVPVALTRTELKLPCVLTDEEVQTRGRMLGDTATQIDALNLARTSAMKEFKDKLEGLNESQRDLALAIRTRIEERIILCAVEFHAPAEGMKTITRLDTGEFVREEPMTSSECQLKLYPETKQLPGAQIN